MIKYKIQVKKSNINGNSNVNVMSSDNPSNF